MPITNYSDFSPTEHYAGHLASPVQPITARSAYNADSETIQYGLLVAKGAEADDAAILPADTDAGALGVNFLTNTYEKINDTLAGVEPDYPLTYIEKGDVWVQTSEAVSPSDSVYVHTAVGTNTPGQFTATAGTDTIELPNSKWLATTDGAGVAPCNITIL